MGVVRCEWGWFRFVVRCAGGGRGLFEVGDVWYCTRCRSRVLVGVGLLGEVCLVVLVGFYCLGGWL